MSEVLTAVTAVSAAVLALVSAVYVARVTRRTGHELEILKARLAQDASAAQSRREYEDRARTRIYEECEPLILKLAMSCETAADRIVQLADPRRWEEMRSTRDVSAYWMLSRSSEIVSFARAQLEPLAYYTLLSEKITLVDLNVDGRVAEIYRLAAAAYKVHLNDYEIAAMAPALPYDPVVKGWREKRIKDPAVYWWQGLTRGRLDPAIELCIHRDAGRLTTLSEFEARYHELFEAVDDSRAKSMGLFCNPMYDFRPESRPVYWRLLMCQLLLYRRIALRSRLPADAPTSSVFDFDRRDVDALQRSGRISDGLLDSGFEVALRYADGVLAAGRGGARS